MKFSSTIMITLIFPAVAFGGVYIYPNKGQSQQQQSKDRYECHTWAVQQTGFNPSRAQAAAPSGSQPGGQGGRGWTAVISEATGKLSATISEDGMAFIIFGACTAL